MLNEHKSKTKCRMRNRKTRNESLSVFNVLKDFDVLIRKRKSSRKNDSLTCSHPNMENSISRVSVSNSLLTRKPMSEQICFKYKTNPIIKYSRRYYFDLTLSLFLVQLLCITHLTECMNINHHRNIISSSLYDSNSRNKHNEKSVHKNVSTNTLQTYGHPRRHHKRDDDNNIQAIQPKICHSLTASTSYLTSAFAHNFASQRPNDLSMENKLVLSPIVFQGKYHF